MDDPVPALLSTALELRSTGDLKLALKALTDHALELVSADQAVVRVLDARGSRLLVGARSGPSVHRDEFSPFEPGEGVIGWVVARGEPALVTDTATDPRFAMRPGQLNTPVSIVAAPLHGSSGPLGVLSMARFQGAAFGERDLDLVQLLGEMAAPHLDVARLAVLSNTDDLTLLYNRRYVNDVLPREMDRARRYGHDLSVLMLDLDHFKKVNDTHGHEIGDQILRGLGDRLRAFGRFADVPSRWGGEEFLVVLPETGASRAREVAERLRRGAGEQPYRTDAGPVRVTLSIGVASLQAGDDPTSLVRRADEALYRAKRAGRNRVE